MKKNKAEKANELAVRRKRDVEYQNKRKEKLEKLGEHSITIRLTISIMSRYRIFMKF